MKSAFELAMERLGGGLKEYSPEEKEQLAEVDRKYDAKVAQVHLAEKERQRKLQGNPQVMSTQDDDLVIELASLEEQREREKEELRQRFGDK